MKFSKQTRQKIIDGYMNATGENVFRPADFIDWLADQPEHPAYRAFYGKSDEEAAREWRIDKARHFVSGLRVVYRDEVTTAQSVTVVTREVPAFVSPMASRRSGGGYVETDPDNLDEVLRQGASALRGWLSRYRGAFEAAGHDLSAIEAIAEDGASVPLIEAA